LIIFGLSASRKETEKIYSSLNKVDDFMLYLESDINDVSWFHSENIMIKRVRHLENKLYNNTKLDKNKFEIIGEVGFYILPYIELLIKNFPYIKFVCTHKNKKKLLKDILHESKSNSNSFINFFIPFGKKFKNHWIDHNGKKWEKDYLLDKCYPKFEASSLKKSIEKYIELYNASSKKIERKYPNNFKSFYSSELSSEYGINKIKKFIMS